MSPQARKLRQLRTETARAWDCGHGYLCRARVQTILTALESTARHLETHPPRWQEIAACGLALLTGTGIGALYFVLNYP